MSFVVQIQYEENSLNKNSLFINGSKTFYGLTYVLSDGRTHPE